MRRLWLLSVVSIGWASVAQANSIDFTTFTSGPAQTITVDGVTISGDNSALVSTITGVGLGVGDDAMFTGTYTGGGTVDEAARLSISVDGVINSFTILAFALVENLDVAQPQFEMGTFITRPTSPGQRLYTTVTAGAETTISMPTCDTCSGVNALTQVGLYGDFGEAWYFAIHQAIDPSLPVSVRYGFSILSMDYTPNAVPEPATVLLLIPAALLWRRHHVRASDSRRPH